MIHHSELLLSQLSAPRYTINAINMKELNPRFLSDQIMIIDFGIAFLQEQSSLSIGTPKSYCAPEFLFNGARSCSSDAWALGCTVFEIRTGTRLFRYNGRPSRNQILTAMIKLLGTLPEKWWIEWEDGQIWYATETKEGGELVKMLGGTLYDQIMDIGRYDGDHPVSIPRQGSIEPGDQGSADDSLGTQVTSPQGTTSRLIAMVGALTTSEAADVVARINKNFDSPEENKSDSLSSSKGQSGSGSGNKTNSGSKSGDKSISSEGLSIGRHIDPNPEAYDNENVIGDESIGGARGLISELTVTAVVREFLEPSGTRISVAEAKGLDNLLRSAMMFLPEERLPPSELAKHHWFSDDVME